MKLKHVILVILFIYLVTAQTVSSPDLRTPQGSPVQVVTMTGSISGTARDASTGTPISEIMILAYASTGSSTGVTESNGRYSLRRVAPGRYSVIAYPRGGGAPLCARAVNVSAGQEVTSIDFKITLAGTISGNVIDQDKEPVSGMTVFLVNRLYSLGAMRYSFVNVTRTDDRGAYRLRGVKAEHPYVVLAEDRAYNINSTRTAPADPNVRRKVLIPTYYPSSVSIEGAVPVVLRSRENREGVDIRMVRSPSYCIEATLQAGAASAPAEFEITGLHALATDSQGSAYVRPPHGFSGPDGKMRICDLYPGEYRLNVMQGSDAYGLPEFFGTASVVVVDRDVQNIVVSARPRLSVQGQVTWSSEPPERPIESKISIQLQPLGRAPTRIDYQKLRTESSVPGHFSFSSVLMDQYAVKVTNVPETLYIKDITCAGVSVLHAPLQIGSSLGDDDVRIVLGHDGGFIDAAVADKDGNPVPDSYVVFMPESARSHLELADELISGQTDQDGKYKSPSLAPGRYYVMARTTAIEPTAEVITNLWSARYEASEVDVGPAATIQITVAPK